MSDAPTSSTTPRFALPDGRLEQRFAEKNPPYDQGQALTEANRCIYCVDAPCTQACPTGIDIPTFIHKIATGNVQGAARTIFKDNMLGATCARVCPVEVLCVGDCVYHHMGQDPIQIGRLQRYATTTALQKDPSLLSKHRKPASGKHIACVGAGPASLAAAAHLALDGHKVTVYEKRALPGGLNTTGIAPYKLSANASLAEVQWLLAQGDIQLQTGVEVVAGEAGEGQVSAAQLLADHHAVFIGLGLGQDAKLGIEGEDGEGVYGAVALIERLKLDPSLDLGLSRKVRPKHAVVIGGGNTAIDIAHELAVLGVRDVSMVYRRGRDRMSAYKHELAFGAKDGVRIVEETVPLAFVRDEGGALTGLKVAKAKDGQAIAGTEAVIPCDLCAVAIGQARLTGLAEAFEGVELDARGCVVVDAATCRTGNAKVYAGGDCVNGGKEVVNAAQHGKLAAAAISASL